MEYRTVEIAGKRIELTEKEFDILVLLIMNQRQVFTYEMIMDTIWHEDFSFYSRNALSSHISNLRKKLKVSETVADHIKSIRGIGYKFEVYSPFLCKSCATLTYILIFILYHSSQ